ncbi:Uncharacterised protein [Zhongshania aliphaticivorans]|uniref:EamA domain-containing protein n=1 Tax=Zhongshania aliphaticivorans TaxID=1470434 RepID=A0A5S9Q252_9GAMM|nr:DMT family transporter [Zhongshania aliphaticivorans]CAA0093199.1 Uncharacterised protein [Zhongshania aliphaticivorans]CAA0110991.1 Uncharacterised protein [Zhongshania aliphaticivorans]
MNFSLASVKGKQSADLLFVIVTLLAAISWIFSKEAVAIMPPLLFMSARFLIAAAFLALIAHHQLRALSAASLYRCVKVGVVFGIAMSLWVLGLAASSHVGEAAFLVSLAVVVVPVVGKLFFNEPVPGSTWVALPIACSGLALLSLNQALKLELAQLLLLAAATLFAIYFNLNTRAANPITKVGKDGQTTSIPQVPVLALTTLVLAIVGVVTGFFSLLSETWHIGKLISSPMVWLWVMLSATVGTAMRFYVQTYAQSLSPYNNGVVIMVLEPVWTSLIAAMWFKESMTLIQLCGCLLIFVALLVNRWRSVQQFLKQLLRS